MSDDSIIEVRKQLLREALDLTRKVTDFLDDLNKEKKEKEPVTVKGQEVWECPTCGLTYCGEDVDKITCPQCNTTYLLG